MKILKIFIGWSALYCLPSFADLSRWIDSVDKSDASYTVRWQSNTDLNRREIRDKQTQMPNDGEAYFQNILRLNWDFRSPHYFSHFANRDGALLNPIRSNANNFPLITGKKAPHTAFKVKDGTIDEFIKKNILENVSSVAGPIKTHNEYMYNVTLSKPIPFYDCEKKPSILQWNGSNKTVPDSVAQIHELNNAGFVMPHNSRVNHRVDCTEMEKTREVVITANEANEVTSIYPPHRRVSNPA